MSHSPLEATIVFSYRSDWDYRNGGHDLDADGYAGYRLPLRDEAA